MNLFKDFDFKEYHYDSKDLSEWIPWGALVRPQLVKNKDGSFLAVIQYQKRREIEEAEPAIKKLVEALRQFASGWAIWMEENHMQAKERFFLTLAFHPKEEKGLEDWFLERARRLEQCLTAFFDASLISGAKLLAYLKETVSPEAAFVMPELPLYLDVLFTQDVRLELESEGNGLKIDGQSVQIVSPLGCFGQARIQDVAERYRQVQRFIFFDEADAKAEEARYMKRWCKNRSSMKELLALQTHDTCGYYTNAVFLYGNKEEALKVQERLQRDGYPSIIESFHFNDVWLGNVPGQFRANINPPIIVLKDISALLAFPAH